MAGHPRNVIFLTCDASGVMPPIARLTPDQAIYHFISGYTSKIDGTEIGLGAEPEITFSTCFGGPFMVHRPYAYAEMPSTISSPGTPARSTARRSAWARSRKSPSA